MMLSKAVVPVGHFLLSISGILVIALLWEIAPGQGWVNARYLPCFSQVLMTIDAMWRSGEIFTNLMVSLWRIVNGLLIAVILGLPLGLMIGRSEGTFDSLNPLLRVLSQANPFSLMPVFILLFGIGEVAKVAVITWVCFWPILFNTITGVRTIDPDWIKTARSVKVSESVLALKVLLPGALPAIFSGIKTSIQMAFFMMIASEMIGASVGLGYLLHLAAMVNQTVRVYAAALTIVVLGIALQQMLQLLHKSVFFWNDSAEAAMGKTHSQQFRLPCRFALILTAVLLTGIIFVGGWQVERTKHFLPEIHSHSGGFSD